MSYGLQIFDSTGSLNFDSSSRLIRIVGKYTGTAAADTNVQVSVPGAVNDGTWFAICCSSSTTYSTTIGTNIITLGIGVLDIGASSISWTLIVCRI
jgi:hypothetical protein